MSIAPPLPPDDDHLALAAAAREGAALCTVTRIEGSWSRRLGAQLAVRSDGSVVGSLADGCLEAALAREVAAGGKARVLRYGAGSPFLDIRLPCGSGVEVLVDPHPDGARLEAALAALERREVADLVIGETAPFIRHYRPRLRLIVLGSGPEASALTLLARTQGVEVLTGAPLGEGADLALALGQAPDLPEGWEPDAWTAVAVLFHDHEWERGLIPWALGTHAFYVGAQGGQAARESRMGYLTAMGLAEAARTRLKSPIGLIPAARTPSVLALSVLAEVVGEYEAAV